MKKVVGKKEAESFIEEVAGRRQVSNLHSLLFWKLLTGGGSTSDRFVRENAERWGPRKKAHARSKKETTLL